TGLHRGALLQPVRGDDVALLAVPVVQQRDAGSAVRVVLDVGDLRRDAVLVVATEVDHPVGLLVAATDVAGGDPAAVVATAGPLVRCQQRLLRGGSGHLLEVGNRGAATTGCCRLVLADGHGSVPRSVVGFSAVGAGEDVDALAV